MARNAWKANMHKLMSSPTRTNRTTCSANGCDMKSGTNKFSEIRMFAFPANPIRRRLWELNARKNANWKSHKNSRICSKHFITGAPSKDPNHPDYVPTIFAFNKHTKNSKSLNRKTRKKGSCGNSSSYEGTNVTSSGIKGFNNKPLSSELVSSAFSQSLEPVTNTLTQMMHKLTEMEEEREQVRQELALCRGEIHQLREAHRSCIANLPSTSTHSVANKTAAEDETEMLQSLYSDDQDEVYYPDLLPSQYLEQIYHLPDEARKNKRQIKKKLTKETISDEMMNILKEYQFPKKTKRKKARETLSDEVLALEECESPKQTKKKKPKETIPDEMMSFLEECQSPKEKREKNSSSVSKGASESPKHEKSSKTSSSITIIYLKP